MIYTTKQGNSLTIGMLLPDNYNIANAKEISVSLGSEIVPHTIIDKMVRVELTSEYTAQLYGSKPLVFTLDDVNFGVYKSDLGNINFSNVASTFANTSVNNGYNVTFALSITPTAITVDSVLYDYVKGDKGDDGADGTTDYVELDNKPSINNVELSGDKTSTDLGLQPAGDYAATEQLDAKLDKYEFGSIFGTVQGAQYAEFAENSLNASSATHDQYGNQIDLHYATQAELLAVEADLLDAIENIPAGGGGGLDVYLSNTADAVIPNYKTLSYSVDTSETELSAVVNNNEVLIGTFLYPAALNTTQIAGGAWNTHFFGKVSTASGVSKIRTQYFLRATNGTETNIVSILSSEINSTDYAEFSPNFSAGLIACNLTDRLGLRVYANTTHNANVTISTIVGDGRGMHFSSPLAFRHSQLRDKNEEVNFQHLDTTQSKTTPIDADSFGLWDSVTSTFKRLSVANMIVYLRTIFAAKSTITDYISLYSRKVATVVNGVITAIQDTWDAHNSRVTADGGTLRTLSSVKGYYNMCYDNGIFDSIKFAWLGDGGSKFRTSGILSYFSKIYSMLGGNDATQTVSTSQPYLSGNIAPNERYALKNPNGGSNFMTHPTISFAANDSWSVTTVLNWNGNYISDLFGSNTSTPKTGFRITKQYNNFDFNSSNGTEYAKGFASWGLYIGKNIIQQLIADGNGNLKLYLNNTIIATWTGINTGFILSDLFRGNLNYYPNGKIHAHTIRSQALTQQQVTAEYNLLRSYIPEIESVQIDTQTWATSNCEMAATPMGNVIAEMQAAANVEKITNIADREFSSDTGFWAKGTQWSISGGTMNCNGSQSGIGSFYRNMNTPGKWYKITYTISSYTQGNFYVALESIAYKSPNRNAVGTYTDYLYQPTTGANVYFSNDATFIGSIDNVSIQEIGWSGSQELYDGIYAQTAGDATAKTYAAVKAAAMWRNCQNTLDSAAVYGKEYNRFAAKLLKMDIDYFNVANPTALWGWRVSLRADLTTLSLQGGNALKATGTKYWNTANGTNASGFTALGGGMVNADGTDSALKTNAYFLCSDADFAREVKDSDNTFDEVAITTQGGFIRLIKV